MCHQASSKRVSQNINADLMQSRIDAFRKDGAFITCAAPLSSLNK